MGLSCCTCGSVSAWELQRVASEGGEREGEDGLGPWRPNAIRASNRHWGSVLDSRGVGFDETRRGAGFEGLPTAPMNASDMPG